MLNKKSVKVLTIVMLLGVILFSVCSPVFAYKTPEPNDSVPLGSFESIAGNVLGILKWFGIVVSVGMLIFLGIKYVTSSPDGKADIKGKIGVYALGVVLILGASMIFQAIQTALSLNGGNAA